MAVTEFALIQKNPRTDISSTTRENLLKVQEAQTGFSEHAVNFLHQIEDSSYYYLLGGWESVEKHTHEWAESETNQKLLKQLAEDFDVLWVFHLELEPSASRIPLDAPVVAISRYFVKADDRARFDAAFQAVADALGTHSALSCCGAWRIDKEGDDEEYVLFSGWDNQSDHSAFTESEASRELGKIRESLLGEETKYVHLQQW